MRWEPGLPAKTQTKAIPCRYQEQTQVFWRTLIKMCRDTWSTKYENFSCAFSLSWRFCLSVLILLLLILSRKQKCKHLIWRPKQESALHLLMGMQCDFAKNYFILEKKRNISLHWVIQWPLSESLQVNLQRFAEVPLFFPLLFSLWCMHVYMLNPYFQPHIPGFVAGWWISSITKRAAQLVWGRGKH